MQHKTEYYHRPMIRLLHERHLSLSDT